jgi:hypothetical protein
MLSVKEAVRLRRLCKALKALVRGWPVLLERLDRPVGLAPENLEAALACFPAAESLGSITNKALTPAEESRVVEVLRGHGGTLKRLRVWGEGAKRLLSSAVRAGALPNLTYFEFSPKDPFRREIVAGAVLPLLKEVVVKIETDDEDQIAALDTWGVSRICSLSLAFRGVGRPPSPPLSRPRSRPSPSTSTLWRLSFRCSVSFPPRCRRAAPASRRSSGIVRGIALLRSAPPLLKSSARARPGSTPRS